jgi:hypothetical protein
MEVILLSIASLNILLGSFVFFHNSKLLSNRLFMLMSFIAALWTLINYKITSSPSFFWLASSYALGSLLISAGLIWTLHITSYKFNHKSILIIIVLSLCFFFVSFKPGFLPPNFQALYTHTNISDSFDYSFVAYTIYYLAFGSIIFYRLKMKRNFNEKNNVKMLQHKYILIGALISFITTTFNSFIFPIFSLYLSKGIDSMGFLVFLICVTYSITKHHLFDIKLIMIQSIISLLWILFFIRILLSHNGHDLFIEIMIFFIVITFGIILTKNILQSIHQRQEIKKLTNILQKIIGNDL